jgi:putative alpha-1,2-mannosidase
MCDPGASADASSPAPHAVDAPLIARVDPFIGTDGTGFGVGSTFPGPPVPFGMVRPGPDTSPGKTPFPAAHCAGYAHDDTWIEGFSHTRLAGAGIDDYGTIALMPAIGMSDAKQTQGGYRQRFSHATEHASPGYYAVTLDDTQIQVELTASAHVAEAAWEAALGKIQIQTRDDRDAKIFYTALYHSLLMPTLGSDVDGSYRGLDGQAHVAQGFRYFTDFSLVGHVPLGALAARARVPRRPA